MRALSRDVFQRELLTFGYSSKIKHFELDKTQVLAVLRRFLDELMEKALVGGYIRPSDKDEFLMPISNMAIC